MELAGGYWLNKEHNSWCTCGLSVHASCLCMNPSGSVITIWTCDKVPMEEVEKVDWNGKKTDKQDRPRDRLTVRKA